MTNKEKANEIELNVYAFEKSKGEFEAPAYRAALEMAEWKDAQFKEYLEKKRAKAADAYSEDTSDFKAGGLHMVFEIINELFGGE